MDEYKILFLLRNHLEATPLQLGMVILSLNGQANRYVAINHICAILLSMKKKKSTFKLLYDECTTLPKSRGNGQLIRKVSVDHNDTVVRYNLVYINYNLCQVDNGRVLGYDNAHGLHHKHYMGHVEPIDFVSYEKIEDLFHR